MTLPTPTMPLRDAHQRSFSYLRLSITDLCNFKCSYCLPNGYQGKRGDELSLNEIETLVAAFARLGFDKIRLTGGEPTTRQDLADIIAVCKAQPGIQRVCITTNGHKLNHFLPQWIAAGIDQVNISIDSLRPEHFSAITSSSQLPQILRAIEQAIEDDFHALKINTVLLREHLNAQILPLMNWIKTRPLSLRFIELMQTGDNRDYFDRQHVSAQWLQNYLQKHQWQQQARAHNAGPAQEYSHPAYRGRVGIIAPYSRDFCNSCNRLRVSAQGGLHLCLFADQAHDLRPFLSAGDVAGLCTFIETCLQQKSAQHFLHQQHSGMTRHLAMLGG